MFYIKNEETNKIIYFNEDRNIVEKSKVDFEGYENAIIYETEKTILTNNGNFCFSDDEKMVEIKKQDKHQENTTKAKEAIDQGYVTYKDAQFETNSQTVGDLTATSIMMQQAGLETYEWLSKDDKKVELTLIDFGRLGNLIAQYKQEVWNTVYLDYKAKIEAATTVEEVEAIEIIYDIQLSA